MCRPLCSHWVGSAEIKSDYVFIAAIASALIGLVSSTILIIIAFTVQRKTLYVGHCMKLSTFSDYCYKSDLQSFATCRLIFPTYYLVYLCMTAFIIGIEHSTRRFQTIIILLLVITLHAALLIVVGLASEGKLFCSSSDLFETFMNETAYCTFSGSIISCKLGLDNHLLHLYCFNLALVLIKGFVGYFN